MKKLRHPKDAAAGSLHILQNFLVAGNAGDTAGLGGGKAGSGAGEANDVAKLVFT